jgi:two-component system response regulator ChvI
MSLQPTVLDSEYTRIVLAEEGFEVVDFSSGESALEYFQSGESADAVLLDWRMPGIDGLGVLQALREARIEIPVIFLTVLSDEIYEEAALKWGAVDFIDKSRRLSIILQRLKLITEGPKAGGGDAAGRDQPIVNQGPLELRCDIRRAFWKEKQVDLTLTEFAIVHYMVLRPGADVTYRQIYDLVRGKDFIRIRKKFREVDSEFDHIENYPGFGYRWRDSGDGEGGWA